MTEDNGVLAYPIPARQAQPRSSAGRLALNTALASRYAEGATIKQLTQQSGFSYNVVRQGLIDHRVQLRPRGGGSHRTPSDTVRPAPLTIGYSTWGYLGDGRLDTVDGVGIRRPVIDAIQAAGHQVLLLQANRDLRDDGIALRRKYRFEHGYPALDAVIFEWGWLPPDRNPTASASAGPTRDLDRQDALLQHYTRDRHTPTVIWDLDRRLPAGDPLRRLPQVRVAEPALYPTPGAISVPCPIPDEVLAETDPAALAGRDRWLPLVYAGDQYDCDDAFEQYVVPAAAQFDHLVTGTWSTTALWPHVNFLGRAGFETAASIHRSALATVLLPPERHATVGQLSSRLFMAVPQGCLPLIPADLPFADRFAPAVLHVTDGAEVITKLQWLRAIQSTREHRYLIAACLLHLYRYRLSTIVDTLLATVHTLADPALTRTPR